MSLLDIDAIAGSWLFCLLNQTPGGTSRILKFLMLFELSVTLNVGSKLAPLKITNLLSSAFVVKTFPFIITVGAWVSGLLAIPVAELSSLFK